MLYLSDIAPKRVSVLTLFVLLILIIATMPGRGADLSGNGLSAGTEASESGPALQTDQPVRLRCTTAVRLRLDEGN